MSRLSTIGRAAALISALALAACGGGSGDDDGAGAPDAAAATPDAEPEATSALGTMCDPAAPACPDSDPVCVAFAAGMPGYCTKPCGTSAPPVDPATEQPMEGMAAQAICQEAYDGTATPACTVYGAETGGVIPWSCGLLCGMIDPDGAGPMAAVNAGTCPDNLTCGDNFCSP